MSDKNTDSSKERSKRKFNKLIDLPNLPIDSKREEIINTIKSHKTTIIVGETGILNYYLLN